MLSTLREYIDSHKNNYIFEIGIINNCIRLANEYLWLIQSDRLNNK